MLTQNRQFQWFHEPSYLYPCVPAYAASLLQQEGHEVAWCDAHAEHKTWAQFEKLGALIEPYTDWFEEADLEGWAMPPDYRRLQRRLEVWDALRTKVRKLKPVNRRR